MPIATLGPINLFDFSFIGALLAVVVALIWFGVAGQLCNLDPLAARKGEDEAKVAAAPAR